MSIFLIHALLPPIRLLTCCEVEQRTSSRDKARCNESGARASVCPTRTRHLQTIIIAGNLFQQDILGHLVDMSIWDIDPLFIYRCLLSWAIYDFKHSGACRLERYFLLISVQFFIRKHLIIH